VQGGKHPVSVSARVYVKDDLLDIRAGIKTGRYINEATISQGIVQRLLDALGWPVYDTEVVVVAPEYSLGTWRADYARDFETAFYSGRCMQTPQNSPSTPLGE
jgi:hypothetical protein